MLTLYTAPTIEPVDLAEVKAHSLPIAADQDPLILGMIVAARQAAESETQRSLLTQTWELSLEDWPTDDIIVLPRPPLASVTSVKYYDTNGVEQTYASTNYYTDTKSEPGRIVLKDASTWPDLESGRPLPITIRYVAGWTAQESVPQAIRTWILMHVAAQNEQRELVASGGAAAVVQTMPFAAGLLDPWRIYA